MWVSVTSGNIHNIISRKIHQGQLFTDWLSSGLKDERAVLHYISMCENYARHITITYPEPGFWWQWVDEKI